MKATNFAFVLMILISTTVGNCNELEETRPKKAVDVELVTKGNSEFALALYEKLRDRKGNLFFSPYSISTALAMAYAGAKGETEKQMAIVLHFPTVGRIGTQKSGESLSEEKTMTQEQFAQSLSRVISDLNARGEKGNYQLWVANALWGQQGYEFLKEFLAFIEKNYEGQFFEVDFVKAMEATRKKINAWIEKKTNNKIKDMIQKGILDSMTRLVLTNAIYFKGNWASQFNKAFTKDAPFTLLNGEMRDVPMMHQKAKFGYTQNDDIQVLELPYMGDELSMIILLPKQIEGLSRLEETLNNENLSQWLSKIKKREVSVFVPRFEMTSQFSLASVLESMGMKDAFSREADFSAMTGKRDLYISAVIHKAYVNVNEEGTEAAAATAVAMKMTAIGPSQTPIFRADHPFVFMIRDNHTNIILFLGRVANPKT
jgi:serpin B